MSCVLLGLALSFHSYLPNVHFGGGTLLLLTVFRMLGEDCDMIVWWRSHKTLVLLMCGSRSSLSPLSPITSALTHWQAVAKPRLNVLGSSLLTASSEVNSHREVPPVSRNSGCASLSWFIHFWDRVQFCKPVPSSDFAFVFGRSSCLRHEHWRLAQC